MFKWLKKMVSKKEKIEKLVYVGGGVATVFSVIKLLNEGVDGSKITIIEAGEPTKTRKREEVMKGFLGAGAWSDGKVLYSLSQGGYLDKYTGKEKALLLTEELKQIIRQFHPAPEKIQISGIAPTPEFIKESPFELKQSECEHLGTDYLYEIGLNIQKFFDEKKVNCMFNTIVEDVDFEKKELTLNTKFKISYDELVIAVGKGGMDFTQKLINKYKLETSPKSTQIGVRFESEYKYFKPLAINFYDFKLHQQINDNVSIRTFCTNNIAAYVAVEETYGMKSYNGHAYKDESKKNDKTNFGILMEIKNIKNPLEFTKDLVKKSNTEGVGKYYTPGNRKPSVEAKKIGEQVFRHIYKEYAEYIINFIKDLDKTFNFGDDYVIYIPEIKYLTNEITVNHKDLSLPKYPNVHLAGDSLSARGIFVSATQGMYISETLIKKLK